MKSDEAVNPELAAGTSGTIVRGMSLEDHLGDIIRKARSMSGISVEAAATAVGLSPTELGSLEQTGQCSARLDLTALAELIGLDARKLQGIASGWLPTKADLNRWRVLKVITTSDGDMSVNCILVWDEETRAAALFDTGFDPALVTREIANSQLQLHHIFITHGHSDHVAGLSSLRQRFPSAQVHTGGRSRPSEQKSRRGEVIPLGRLQIAHRVTPGHADDGVTYLISHWPDDAPQVAIVGDALFAGSMGRAPGAWELARTAVREEILSLPSQTLLCPGHGPVTTVGEEVAHNPFF